MDAACGSACALFVCVTQAGKQLGGQEVGNRAGAGLMYVPQLARRCEAAYLTQLFHLTRQTLSAASESEHEDI